jgi:hypothetical protein
MHRSCHRGNDDTTCRILVHQAPRAQFEASRGDRAVVRREEVIYGMVAIMPR